MQAVIHRTIQAAPELVAGVGVDDEDDPALDDDVDAAPSDFAGLLAVSEEDDDEAGEDADELERLSVL